MKLRLFFFLVIAGLVGVELLITNEGKERDYEVQYAFSGLEHGWRRINEGSEGWFDPYFVGRNYEFEHLYSKNGERVSLYATIYPIQDSRSELINYNNRLFDKEKWRLVYEGRASLGLVGGALLVVNEVELVNAAGSHKLLWYWYSVSNALTPSTVLSKLYQLKNVFWSNVGSGVIAISTDIESDNSQARKTLEAFLKETGVFSAQVESFDPIYFYGHD